MAKNKYAGSVRKVHLISEKSNFQMVEAYKTLRSNLLFALPKSKCKKILFTSALSVEGKTTSCVNLAITLAQLGSRVLLIDGDLRKPRTHVYFKLKNSVGFSNIICGMTEVNDAIQPTTYENLYSLPSGIISPNPSELLASEECKNLLKYLEDYFEFILIDTPPVNVVSDALVLCNNVDGVVVVAKQNQTKMEQLAKAVDSLNFADAKILGLILNGVNKKGNSDYTYSAYGYGYNYK